MNDSRPGWPLHVVTSNHAGDANVRLDASDGLWMLSCVMRDVTRGPSGFRR